MTQTRTSSDREENEARPTLERKAMREILGIISRSREDEQPVFDVIVKSAKNLCDALFAGLVLGRECDKLSRMVASENLSPEILNLWENGRYPMIAGDSLVADAIINREIKAIDDMADTHFHAAGDDRYKVVVTENNLRSNLYVPLILEGEGIGCLVLARDEVLPYNSDEIQLIETFAAQAVIAIENARQFREVQVLNASLEARVEAQVAEIERMGRLRRFLPPAVADAIVSSGSEGLLASHRALVGVLFADIRGFTAFCEQAEPEEAIEVLQIYHQEMGRLISNHAVGVDHRSGDGIMVIFNDPLPCDDPAGEAVKLGLAMRTRMSELCQQWRKMGHRLGFGVGISLGYATVGMVGSEGRYEYTASGTVVNLAARLSDHAQDGIILLSPRAFAAVEDWIECETAGELILKGLAEPVEVRKVNGILMGESEQ